MTMHRNTQHSPSQRNQRFWAIVLLLLLTTVLTAAPVQAETRIYLPHIGQETAPPTTEQFTVEWVRLWSVWENGGSAWPLTCGRGGTLQVDVFDRYGEGSRQPGTVNGRLNDITVVVTHTAADGSRTRESQVTGSNGFDAGVTLFTLAPAETVTTVQIRTEVESELVSSPPITVTGTGAAIPMETLLDAGYCTDDTTCRALIEAEQCNGTFSWGVVFKRMF